MRIRAGDILLLAAAAVVISGCMAPVSRDRAAAPRAKAARSPIMSVAPADAVKTFKEALVLVADLQYKQAAEKFKSVVNPLNKAGDVSRAAEAIFWFGYCREKVGDFETARMQAYHDSARLLYKRLIEHYPKSAAAARATQRLAALKRKTGKP